jgi:lipid-A-disaccharide synthase-like uncharacterized protein
MNTASFWIFAIGFLAQLLFAARMFIQWLRSEKAGKSLSPVIFWQISVAGSLLFLLYGVLRHDFAIILGQILVYFIYIRNLHLHRHWNPVPLVFRGFMLVAPILTLGYLLTQIDGGLSVLLINNEISWPLLLWGSAGQVIFTLRFYIQLIDSETKNESLLTQRFWGLSLLGSVMIITYAFFRYDPVLLLGQLTGLVVYIRNLVLASTKSYEG